MVRFIRSGQVSDFLNYSPNPPVETDFHYHMPKWENNSCFFNVVFAIFFAEPNNAKYAQMRTRNCEITGVDVASLTIQNTRHLIFAFAEGRLSPNAFREQVNRLLGPDRKFFRNIDPMGDSGDVGPVFCDLYMITRCSAANLVPLYTITSSTEDNVNIAKLFDGVCPQLLAFEFGQMPTQTPISKKNAIRLFYTGTDWNQHSRLYTLNALVFSNGGHVIVVIQHNPGSFCLYDDLVFQGPFAIEQPVRLDVDVDHFATFSLPSRYKAYKIKFITYTRHV